MKLPIKPLRTRTRRPSLERSSPKRIVTEEPSDVFARQLVRPFNNLYFNPGAGGLQRRLDATGDDEDATPSNLFHINLQELSSLLDCQDGCKAAFALITSNQCNSTDAQDSALEFKLEKDLTFDTTHIQSDEDAPDNGWVTRPFRELMTDESTDNTADSSPPISMADFVAAAAMVTEFIDAMTPDQDFNLAVYLYNNETEPLACATLDLVTDDDELQEYYNLFGGGDGEGSDVVEGCEGNASPLSGGFLAYAVAGVVLSAILFD